MAFWSGERLAVELAKGLVRPFDPNSIDCASYPLRVGGEAFVTSDRFATAAPGDPLVSVLNAPPNHTLRIPPGQFAFLLTHEEISVPTNAIALISIKAKYKFQGLINVSGFHVDPGFNGKLLFSVYNAGPTEVIVQNKQTMFMIVYADLDQDSKVIYKGPANGRASIDTALIQGMTSQVFSPLMLQRKIEALSTRIEEVDRDAALLKTVTISVTTIVGILLALAALFATFAPATVGIILARVIEGGGYELKQRATESAQVPGIPSAANANIASITPVPPSASAASAASAAASRAK